jgi:hypothetical protein
VNQPPNSGLRGWRNFLWVQDDNPTHQWTNEDVSAFGQGNKVKLLCCLNCKSELWGHPARCPNCLRQQPPRR